MELNEFFDQAAPPHYDNGGILATQAEPIII